MPVYSEFPGSRLGHGEGRLGHGEGQVHGSGQPGGGLAGGSAGCVRLVRAAGGKVGDGACDACAAGTGDTAVSGA